MDLGAEPPHTNKTLLSTPSPGFSSKLLPRTQKLPDYRLVLTTLLVNRKTNLLILHLNPARPFKGSLCDVMHANKVQIFHMPT